MVTKILKRYPVTLVVAKVLLGFAMMKRYLKMMSGRLLLLQLLHSANFEYFRNVHDFRKYIKKYKYMMPEKNYGPLGICNKNFVYLKRSGPLAL